MIECHKLGLQHRARPFACALDRLQTKAADVQSAQEIVLVKAGSRREALPFASYMRWCNQMRLNLPTKNGSMRGSLSRIEIHSLENGTSLRHPISSRVPTD